MSKNTGIPYEVLTQQIFQSLHDQDEVNNIEVKQNVTLQGKTISHQIDVYWEFERGGIVYRAVVQAKDLGRPVIQSQLLAFKAILDDLPSQPRGVFVTRSGYQKGARVYAEAHGIALYELREPTDKDMEGKVMTIRYRLSIFVPTSTDIEPIFDQDWIVAECRRRGFGLDEHTEISISGREDQVSLLNERDENVGTFRTVIAGMFPEDFVELPRTRKEHLFAEPTFLMTGNTRFPKMKLLGVRATITVERRNEEQVLRGEDFVGFVLRDVIGDKTHIIDKDRQVIPRPKDQVD